MENLDQFEGKKRKPENDLIHLEESMNSKTQNKKGKKDKKERNTERKDYTNFTPYNNLKSEKFEFYYKTQLKGYFENDSQFDLFIEKLKEKLPCVFRINVANKYWKEFRKILTNPDLVKDLLNGQDYGIKIQSKNLTNLEEFKDLIYNINIPRFELKKNDSLTKFHEFIRYSVDSGLISRQEAVSMIPPLLMQVKASDGVLDTCAAPGSKTAQFFEAIYRDYDFLNPESIANDSGFVIANDNNFNRAYMMTHQLKRLNTIGLMVVSHDAQFFPLINSDFGKILFDKILCDVPCSSDAVLRKLPNKWKNWSPKDSFHLHKLQIQILKKAISLLKVGGTIIYSTCSLNPIENEAVVAEIMKSHDNTLEIVDMSKCFEGSEIKARPGLNKWKVMVEDKNDFTKLIEIKKDDSIYEQYKELIEESCFAGNEIELNNFKIQNCIRLFPHDSDTSGFFITVIKKISSLTSLDKPPRNKTAIKEQQFTFIKDNIEIAKWITDYYGLVPKFPIDQLVTQSGIAKKINLVSKGVLNVLNSDKRNQLKLITFGVKIFALNKRKVDEDFCQYRLCQDGLIYLIPFITKRIFFCNQDFLIKILKEVDIKITDLEDIEMRENLEKTTTGCIILVNVKNKPQYSDITKYDYDNYITYLRDNYVDSLCCYVSSYRVSSMINKEHQFVFNLKYNIDKQI